MEGTNMTNIVALLIGFGIASVGRVYEWEILSVSMAALGVPVLIIVAAGILRKANP